MAKKAAAKTGGKTRSTAKIETVNINNDDDFPVVGVGASAGGLEAFGKLLTHMPTDTGMAFVLVQHLDPTHASNMVELLRRYTKMPVHEATENIKLEPDHVYMIPPNRNMTITDRTLQLMEALDRPGIMHSIDMFFRSLAEDLKEKAICIILSGTGTDGSLGAKAVKAELGMVMVQHPDNASYDGMPRAAIASGVADFILPAEQMARQLVEYIQKSYGKRAVRRREVEKDYTSLATILSLIRARTKHDFTGYKQSTINRRIERRMGINQIDNISEYLRYLREHQGEVEALVKDFLINVTSFFRDPEAFVALKGYLKKLLENKSEGAELRAWAPGCSTGEEAYSIAMLLEEAMEENHKYCELQVFGTDLDVDAINIARNGSYPASIAADVGEERLKRFFVRNDDQYQVKRDLREKLVFAVQDIIADPPFTRMDMISARNLLIYFDSDLQKRLIPMFHYALNQNSLLFLGTAETVGEFAELFTPVDRRWKIYQAEAKSRHTPFTMNPPEIWNEQEESKSSDKYKVARPALPARPLQEVMLEAMPSSMLLDSSYQVLYSHGDTRRYVGFPEGKPHTVITELVIPEMRASLASALHEAIAQKREAVREGIRVKNNGDTFPIKITVKPVLTVHPGEPKGRLIVTFEDVPKAKKSPKKDGQTDTRVTELEQELQFTKETLRSTIEELETANEELRSANEEYQSTNEELQSTNEELETSREELQSVNEELSTVNAEHQAKIEELSTSNDDMKNLLNSMPVATLYLDNQMRVKRFTPAATGIFNLISSDVDRPINHITSQMVDYNIEKDAQNVVNTLVAVEKTIRSKDNKYYLARITPYRTSDNAIAGVVVTFMDTTQRVNSEDTMAKAKGQLASMGGILDSISDALFVIDRDWRYIYVNTQGLDLAQKTREKMLGMSVWEVFPQFKGSPMENCYREAMKETKRKSCEFYHKEFGMRAEHRVYPTKDGLLDFVTDINIKKAEVAEQNSK